MQPSTSTQLKVGVVLGVLAAAGIAWRVTHQKGGTAPSGFGDLKAPKLVDLRALGPSGERKLDGAPELQVNEVLDFHVEVADPCFVYVFREQAGAVGLAWGHPLVEEAWNPGVYAPDWVDTRGGMPFQQSGTVRLFAIASPTPQSEAAKWTLDTLENLKATCAQCGMSTLQVAIAQP
jgi:hypothetical protein